MKRPSICLIHFNKHREAAGLPWTVHVRGQCIPAAHVKILVPVESREKPDKKSNPRYFFACRGLVTVDDDNVVTIS